MSSSEVLPGQPRRTAGHALTVVTRPPTASTPLWAHFMQTKSRVPTTLADIPAAVPPPAPLDKNATSMRILLHDTQANLEKFGGHVQKLVEGVQEAKAEMKTANSLFERDREGFMGDIADLINRTQREIQNAVGSPAQDERMHSFFKDFDSKISRLDQRLDALQTFNQTHSQALQSQMQAVQILMDKQASIMAAVLPLLPLVQALPLYIDAAKTSICEKTMQALSDHISGQSDRQAGSVSCDRDDGPAVCGSTKRKRMGSSSERSSPDTTRSPALPRKRSRKEKTGASPHTCSPADNGENDVPDSLQRLKPPTSPEKGASEVPEDPTSDQISTLSTTRRRSTSSATGQFVTPRRPLSELLPSLLPQGAVVTPRARVDAGSVNADATTLQQNLRGPAVTPSLLRAGLQGAKLTPSAVQALLSMPAAGTRRPPRLHSRRLSAINALPRLFSPVNASNTGIRSTEGTGSRSSSTIPSAVPSAQSALDTSGSHFRTFNITSASGIASNLNEKGTNNLRLSALFGKDRRSPSRDRRRFIPLVDSDDEEEE